MSQIRAAKSSWKIQHVGLMILGFVFFWPLGLAMLAYMIWGEEMRELFKDFKTRVDQEFKGSKCGQRHRHYRRGGFEPTGNVAFDEYRKAELQRLEEERRKLEAERAEFEDFLTELRRVKDKEEFDRFMAARHNSNPTAPSEGAPYNDQGA
ncbi:Protein of unknown function [Cohaesibacter sp. ES.047]|uniref:DUF2852 domain-containing protein n=1 Tax=Cohaesibacter sp. ES.047 TaxID=1798205 RepID=UPI000BB69CFD|nr:DUF2852 domain-containing protein [Cohaesibacter sp. ES.047]SNY90127.1 Protein of unknown function [Cohaesibacter sp. ES.047]